MYLSKDKAYEILGLNSNLEHSHTDIKRAYKKKALEYHPDKNQGSDEQFIKVKLAYEVLISQDDEPNFDAIFHKIIETFSRFVKNLMKPDEFFDAQTKLTCDINLNLSITLEELYKEEGKKLRIKYLNIDEKLEYHTVYISFRNYSERNIFHGKGDWDVYNRIYGDLIIHLNISNTMPYIIDSCVDKYDLMRTIPISLCDYYCGVDIKLDHFGEIIHICCKPVDISTDCTLLVIDKGLKHYDKRGDLYIIFDVQLKHVVGEEMKHVDMHKIFPSLL